MDFSGAVIPLDELRKEIVSTLHLFRIWEHSQKVEKRDASRLHLVKMLGSRDYLEAPTP
jgi:hypothetical protein